MDLAAVAHVRVQHEVFPLDAANDALLAIARDGVRGAAVLQVA
jgi:D-arabinose 1-dehydrogenase-like Zn-dependent alcohol dehydrogenase